MTDLIAKEAQRQGLISNANDVEVISPGDADKVTPHAAVLLATNAKQRETVARTKLNWQPKGPSLLDEIPEIVRREASL